MSTYRLSAYKDKCFTFKLLHLILQTLEILSNYVQYTEKMNMNNLNKVYFGMAFYFASLSVIENKEYF